MTVIPTIEEIVAQASPAARREIAAKFDALLHHERATLNALTDIGTQIRRGTPVDVATAAAATSWDIWPPDLYARVRELLRRAAE